MPDTIVALSTPLGRSGIGVVRLSGSEALTMTRRLIGDNKYAPEPRTAHVRQLIDPKSGDVIDEAVITFFRSPHSFTGEDIVEISCHGSPVILRQIIDISLREGARLAEAGEFTLRAVANNRVDLAEAEAIRDLIEAQTAASARQAVKQLRGEFSHQLQPIKDELLDVIVILESALEFVEDDLPEAQTNDVRRRMTSVAESTRKIASTFQAGKLIREGITVALVGRPNVGKSSLFNALLGSDRAIVTEIAGTTRDQLHERLTISDIPVSLIDTAGLRETTDTVESIGVERSRRTMADADVVVVMFDASEDITAEDVEILRGASDLDHLVVINKIDRSSPEKVDREIEEFEKRHALPIATHVSISAKTGEGLQALKCAIVEPFSPSDISASGFLVTDARHHDLLLRAESEVIASIDLLDKKQSEEIILIGLHNALRYLGQITGETTTEDMLTRIFSTFCIGK